MAESHSHPTGLAKWLDINRVKAGQLARELGVSPHAIAHLRDGSTANVCKTILAAVARRTQLSYEAILSPAEIVENPIATGDSRIDRCLGSIARYLHTPEMQDKCRRYFSADFLCSGKIYQKSHLPPVGFDQMCSLNAKRQYPTDHVSAIVVSTSWYAPRHGTTTTSRILHSYWRAVHTKPNAALDELYDPSTEYSDTFIVLEFEQSIEEMSPLDTPKITSWWWDTPAQYSRVPKETYRTAFDQQVYTEIERVDNGAQANR